jgi:phage gp36-like protein
VPYTTASAVKSLLTALGGADQGQQSAAQLPTPRIQLHVDQAQADVDSVLAGRYAIPLTAGGVELTPAPPVLTRITEGIAAWFATLEANGSQPLEPTDPVQLRYEAARAILEEYRDGRRSVPAADPVPAAASAGGDPVVYGGPYPSLDLVGAAVGAYTGDPWALLMVDYPHEPLYRYTPDGPVEWRP